MSCDKISIYDISGFYNVTTNPTGWGTPNLARDFEGTAIMTIKFGTSVNEYDIKATIEDAIFPEFLLYEYSTGDTLLDGVYTISVVLFDTDTNTQYVASKKEVSLCNVECCVSKMGLKVAESCNCDTLLMENFSKAEQILSTLKLIGKNLGEKEFNKQLSILQKICSTNDCGCGCS